MGHHKPPCRAHPIHTENIDLGIIYRPERYRNQCVCCCCGNGMWSKHWACRGQGGQGRQWVSTLGALAHTRHQESPRNERQRSMVLPVHWLLSRKPAPPGCSAACWLLGVVQTAIEIIQNDVPKPGRKQPSAEEPFKILALYPKPAASGSLEGETQQSVCYFPEW